MNNTIKRLPNGDIEVVKKDVCVMCHLTTEYDVDTPVSERSCYVGGAGQLCYSCDKKLASWSDSF